MRTVTNVDGIVKTFETDQEFLTFAKEIFMENEIEYADEEMKHYNVNIGLWEPENISNAVEYINEYCGNLELMED